MVMYEVFSQTASYKYKTSLCSKATLFLCFAVLITIITPLLIAYKSDGFWLKSSSYREQPHVRFKHEYILIIETARLDTPIICTTFTELHQTMSTGFRDCSMVKSRENDKNMDGKNDELVIELEVPLQNTDQVHGVKLFLFFDYRLYKLSSLTMDSLGYLEHSSSLAGSRLDTWADLSLSQKTLLSSRGHNSQHDRPIVDTDAILRGDFDLSRVIGEYAARNVSTRLRHVYHLWSAGRAAYQPFTVRATVFYPESSVEYRPGFWQVIKWAWMQYLALLAVVGYVMRRVVVYVFSNHLVVTARVEPWKHKDL